MAEVAKYTTALATGALVFSADLVTKDVTLTRAANILLIISWVSITLSIIAGILCYSRFPIMTADDNKDIEDGLLVWPGRIHQVLLLIGIFFLGGALVVTLFAGKPEKRVTNELQLQREIDDVRRGNVELDHRLVEVEKRLTASESKAGERAQPPGKRQKPNR
jgi:hypothetical protein